jgi:hypothetical protein
LFEIAQAAPQRLVQAIHAELEAFLEQPLRTRRPVSAGQAGNLMGRRRTASILSDIHERTRLYPPMPQVYAGCHGYAMAVHGGLNRESWRSRR